MIWAGRNENDDADEDKKHMGTIKKKRRRWFCEKKEEKKEKKRKERKNEMSGPAFLNYKGRDNKIYEITNLPLY